MALTTEDIEQLRTIVATKEDLKNLPTKQDLTAQINAQTDELARILAHSFEDVEKRFDQLEKMLAVEKEVETLKADIRQIKQALHLTS